MSRPRAALVLSLAALVALNVLLFVPGFALAQPRAALLPFFPTEHPHGPYAADLRSAWEYLKMLGLRRENLDPFRLCVELTLLSTAALWWPRARWLRRLTVGAYGASLVLLTYQHSFRAFFQREPALWEDWRLVRNLFHYVTDQWSWVWAMRGVGVLLAWGLPLLALSAALRHLAALEHPKLRAAGLALSAYALACLAWFGTSREDPVARLAVAALADNWKTSRARAQEFEALAQAPADPRYDAFARVKLQRRPSVALMMIEAYGELAAACDTGPAYRALMQRMEARLALSGYHARTAFSRAPVYGGQSWLSISSVQLGMRIDTAAKYALVENVGARTPSLTRFFEDQGYTTAAVQPGNTIRTGLKGFDVFARKVVVDAPELGYTGFRYGWQGIPDQYTLGRIGELLPTLPRPWLLFSMNVSTHHPWDAPFVFVRDWKALQDPNLDTHAAAMPWVPIAERAQIAEPRQGYFRTVEYEWRGLAQLMEGELEADTVFLVLGDHQPKLPCDGDKKVTWNTPFHVITRDVALLDRLAVMGFDEGLQAPVRERPLLVHEGLFPMLVALFAAHWGDAAQTPLQPAPEGISLRSLYR